MYVDAVDTVLVDALVVARLAAFDKVASTSIKLVRGCPYMWGTEDRAVPVGHHEIVAICKTIGAGFCPGRSEHGSSLGYGQTRPNPFSPLSSSSSSLKLRGTIADIVEVLQTC